MGVRFILFYSYPTQTITPTYPPKYQDLSPHTLLLSTKLKK